jgi:predicted RNA-binding protein YlqC (UPF0109 family)
MVDSRTMQALLKKITEALVDAPEEVRIDCITEGTTDRFRLYVAPNDVGKMVGKQGRHARAIREILACASQRSRRFALDIVEPPSH